MLKKEIKEVLKQTFFLIISMFFFIYFLYLIFMKQDFSFSDTFLIFYQMWLLFFSFFFGISLFSSEIRNKGVEYLLTFPVSRAKLLFYKIFPRFAVLLIFYFVYLGFRFMSSTDPFLFSSISFNSIYFSIFFISVSLSVLRDNFVANSVATFFLIILYIFTVNFVGYVVLSLYFKTDVGFGLALFTIDESFIIKPVYIFVLSTLLALPFLFSFFLAFKKFDVRSSRNYLKRFFKFFIPMFLVAMILSFFIVNSGLDGYPYFDYYLTKNNKVIKNAYSNTYVYDGNSRQEIPRFSARYYSSYEDKTFIYSSMYKRVQGKREWGLFRLNKDTLKIDKIYAPEGDNALVRKVYGYRDKIAVMETADNFYRKREGKRSIIFIDTGTLKINRVKNPNGFFSFCGVIESEGKRLWISHVIRKGGVAVYTVNEDGTSNKILWSERRPLYVNNRLISYRDGHFVFGQVSEAGYKEIKKVKIDREYHIPIYPGFFGGDLKRKYTRFIYGKKMYDRSDMDFLKVDLETLEIKMLSFDYIKRGIIRKLSGEGTLFLRFKETGPAEINGVFRFEGDKLVPVKIFEGEIFKFWMDIGIFNKGIMVRRKKGITIYSLPEYKELTFKKLN
ncbi:MAG: hypothetical protein ABFR75_05705 [Acidobacteriota bacterium]